MGDILFSKMGKSREIVNFKFGMAIDFGTIFLYITQHFCLFVERQRYIYINLVLFLHALNMVLKEYFFFLF